MKEQEDKVANLPKYGVIKQMQKGKPTTSVFAISKKEEFISYENWKKFQEGGTNLLYFYLFNQKIKQKYLKRKMETIDGDFVVVSDPVNTNEKEAVENLFKKLIDEKVPNKKFANYLRKNSESTDEEFKKSEKSGLLSFYLS